MRLPAGPGRECATGWSSLSSHSRCFWRRAPGSSCAAWSVSRPFRSVSNRQISWRASCTRKAALSPLPRRSFSRPLRRSRASRAQRWSGTCPWMQPAGGTTASPSREGTRRTPHPTSPASTGSVPGTSPPRASGWSKGGTSARPTARTALPLPWSTKRSWLDFSPAGSRSVRSSARMTGREPPSRSWAWSRTCANGGRRPPLSRRSTCRSSSLRGTSRHTETERCWWSRAACLRDGSKRRCGRRPRR